MKEIGTIYELTLNYFKTNYIKKLTKKVYFYAIDDTKPSTYG